MPTSMGTGNIVIYSLRTVVDAVADPCKEITLSAAQRLDPAAELGSEVREAKPTDALGRISAQTAKQVILQKVREAERDSVYSEFNGRQGELVNCIVKRVEGQDYIVDMGKTEARLPKKEQSRIESSASATVCAASSRAWNAVARMRGWWCRAQPVSL